MQGFGGSPLSWQQADVVAAQKSLCQSCSTAASNVSFDYLASCTCAHDPADIHTYVPEKSNLRGWVNPKFLFHRFATHNKSLFFFLSFFFNPCNGSEVSPQAPGFKTNKQIDRKKHLCHYGVTQLSSRHIGPRALGKTCQLTHDFCKYGNT